MGVALTSTVLFGIIPVILLRIVLPLALAIFLQVWLCKRGPKQGLVLPGVSFFLTLLVSLVLLLNMSYTSAGSTLVSCVDENGQTIVVEEVQPHGPQQGIPVRAMTMVGVVFLAGNIPTVVFMGIWLQARKQRIKVDDLNRMSIEDLE